MAGLGLDQLDLFLIHWPLPTVYDGGLRLNLEGRDGPGDRRTAAHRGVSNFQPAHLDRIIGETGITPAVNQFELHPYFANRAVRDAAARHGIAIEAHSPLGHDGKPLSDETIIGIAAARGKTPAQVILRWPTSARHDRHPQVGPNLSGWRKTLAVARLRAVGRGDRGCRRARPGGRAAVAAPPGQPTRESDLCRWGLSAARTS